MIDFARDEETEKNFIVDLSVKDGNLIITYADGRVETEKYSFHNLNVYRIHMEQQAKENMDYAYDTIAKDSFFTYVKKFLAVAGGIIAGIVVYNIDIHLIMKIILTLLILIGEVLYYLYNELYLSVLGDDLVEVLATDYYLKNINQFKYYDAEAGENGYIVPIEEIDKYHLTESQLREISDLVTKFRQEGVQDKNISLTYQKPNL